MPKHKPPREYDPEFHTSCDHPDCDAWGDRDCFAAFPPGFTLCDRHEHLAATGWTPGDIPPAPPYVPPLRGEPIPGDACL